MTTHVAYAASGRLVRTTTFSSGCGSGKSVGVAFDGAYLWFSCTVTGPDLYRADPVTGAVSASYTIAGGIGAIAYDADRNALWAGWDTYFKGIPAGDVTYIPLDASHNVVTSGVTVAFNVGSTYATNALVDGIAYDATDDSVYVSPDQSTTIDRFSATTGAYQDSRSWVGTSCTNSGIALGAEQIYESAAGCATVYTAARVGNAAGASFAIPEAGRGEGLACDALTFAPTDVLWAVNNNGASASAYEIPPLSCGVGGRNAGIALADAFTAAATVTDAAGVPIAALAPVADARAMSGTATNRYYRYVLPPGPVTGEIVTGANSATVGYPFGGSGSASSQVASVRLVLGQPACPEIDADGITAVATLSSSGGAAGPYTVDAAGSRIAHLTVCGKPVNVGAAPTPIVLPGGLGTLALFDQVAYGDGTHLAEMEVDALHLHLTVAGTVTDLVVAAAYAGAANTGTLSPRPRAYP